MNKTFKRIMSLVVAAAVAVSGVAATGTKASAASSYKAFLMFGAYSTNGGNFDATYGSTTVKGSGTYTVTLTAKQVKAAAKKAGNTADPSKGCMVCCVDISNILKGRKASAVKVSGVSVKLDGKTMSGLKKAECGQLEKKADPNKYRICLFNTWGDDKTYEKYGEKYGQKFKFKKSISVTFKISYK